MLKIPKELTEYKQKLNKLSKEKEEKQVNFIDTLRVLNNKTGEIFQLSYDLQNEYRKTYIDLIQKSIFITSESEKQNLDSCLFITLTLNSQFHKYKQNTDKTEIIENKNYRNYSVKDSYKKLNETMRNMYNEFNKNDKYRNKIDYKFVKVIEQHKTLSPHLHLLLFVNSEDVSRVIEIVERKINYTDKQIIKTKDNNKIRYNSNYKKNVNNDIGRVEIEQIRDIKKGVGYLSKYIKKQFTTENKEDLHLLDGWKRDNKIRLITTSNINIPKYVYKRINNLIDNKTKEQLIKEEINILNYIVENTQLEYITTDLQNNITKEIKNNITNFVYKVEVYKTEHKKRKFEEDYTDLKEEINIILRINKNKSWNITEKDIYRLTDYMNKEDLDFFIKLQKEEIEENLFCNIKTIEDLVNNYEYSMLDLLEDLFEYLDNNLRIITVKEIENIKIFKGNELVYNKEDFEVIGVLGDTEI